jgi:hypothetical protein
LIRVIVSETCLCYHLPSRIFMQRPAGKQAMSGIGGGNRKMGLTKHDED